MKIIIYLASGDQDAFSNFTRLYVARESNLGSAVKFDYLGFKDGKLYDIKKDLFKDIPLSEKDNITIEFIAHGSPHVSNEILISPEGALRRGVTPEKYEALTPQSLFDFFKNHATDKDSGEYKFKNLTLFCCSKLAFGKTLSTLMPEIKITCFAVDIKIDESGMVIDGRHQQNPIVPYIFSNGTQLSPVENKNDEEIKLEVVDEKSKRETVEGNLSVSSRSQVYGGSRDYLSQSIQRESLPGKKSWIEVLSDVPDAQSTQSKDANQLNSNLASMPTDKKDNTKPGIENDDIDPKYRI